MISPDQMKKDFDNYIKNKFQNNYKKPIMYVVLGILFLIVIFNCFFQLNPSEKAVITTLGSYDKEVGAGLHFIIPFIQDYKVVNMKSKRLTFGKLSLSNYDEKPRSRFSRRDRKAKTSTTKSSHQTRLLTGDLNILDIDWEIQYSIESPTKYHYIFENTKKQLGVLAETVLQQEIGNMNVDDVLLDKRGEIQQRVADKLQSILDGYNFPEDTLISNPKMRALGTGAGINIKLAVLSDVKPPGKEVSDAFQAVNQARQNMQERIEQARANQIKDIQTSQGDAITEKKTADAFKELAEKQKIAEYKKMFTIYRECKRGNYNANIKRIFIEEIAKIMSNVKNKVYIASEKLMPIINFSGNTNSLSIGTPSAALESENVNTN